MPVETIPVGYCQCGCGQPTNIAPHNDRRYECVKGQPRRFVNGHWRRRPLAERFWEKVERGAGPGDCWLWTASKTPQGYGHIGGAAGKILGAHRVSWELHNGAVPVGLQVLHRCDRPSCVNPAHLFLGSNSDNVADKIAKGRGVNLAGEAHGMSKLSEAKVREIRALVAGGAMQKEVASYFGVGETTVANVVARRTWAHVS